MVTAWLGPLLVALGVSASALYALRHLAPRSSARLQAMLIRPLLGARAPYLRRWGERLMPRTVSGGACGSGCSSCGGCATPGSAATSSAAPREQPLEFTRRRP